MVWRIEKSEKMEWNGMEWVEWLGETWSSHFFVHVLKKWPMF